MVTMNYISRAEWGARPPKSVKPINTSDALFVHHTVTATGPDEAAIVRQVQSFHMDSKGWQDIAYSWLVGQSGRIYEGRGWGVAGGHTEGHNSTSHAVCFIGNSDTDVPTKAALDAIATVHAEHARRYGTAVLRSHRDVNQTGCPGAHLAAWVAAPTRPTSEEFTVDAEARNEFFELRKRIDERVLPQLADLKAWQLNIMGAIARDDATTLTDADLADIAKAVADEQARRLAS